jgi:predicted heme/steroid binding protein
MSAITIYHVVAVFAIVAIVAVGYKMYSSSNASTVTHPDPSMRDVKRKYTLQELSRYSGYKGNSGRPILLSHLGDVYDVTAGGRSYGFGGAYQMLSGKDASRSFGLNCFTDECLLPDVRDMTPEQISKIKATHAMLERTYPRVGFVDAAELVSTDAQLQAANDRVEAIRQIHAR